MKIFFEKANENDLEVISKMLAELYTELGEEKQSVNFLSAELLASILSSGNTEIYFVKEGSEIAGIFTLTESQAIYAGGKFGVVDEMYVKADYRGQKVGEGIIKFISKIAKHKGWSRIDVTAPTEEKWERTKKFYEKNGFVFTGPKYKLSL